MGTTSLMTELSPSLVTDQIGVGAGNQSLAWVRASQQSDPRVSGWATLPRPRPSPSTHLLGLVPGDWLHFRVGQQVWAVTHLHVHHALLGLHLNELISNPFDGLPAAPGKRRGWGRWLG